MSFIIWVTVLGAVLLILALTSSYLRWLPVTTSAVCLLLGIGIGPGGLDLLKLPLEQAFIVDGASDRSRRCCFRCSSAA